MKRRQEIEVSNKLIKSLIERGFLVHKYYARTTKSVYLKLDDLTEEKSYQTSLFDTNKTPEKDEKLDKIIDQINDKYGKQVLKRASNIANIKK